MSSKPKKRKSGHEKKKKKTNGESSRSSPPSTKAKGGSRLDEEAPTPSRNGLPPPELPKPVSPEREASAEEIFQASIDFQSTALSNGFDQACESILYPSMDQLRGEEKREEDDDTIAVPTAAAVATIPSTVAAVCIEEDDDPVMRKLREEERFVQQMMMQSSNSATAQDLGSSWAVNVEDVKPAAFNDSQVAEIVEHDVHPAEMDHGVQAELIGEADMLAVAAPSAIATASIAQDDFMTEEATVLDSKPAAVPPGWGTEDSAEATVLGAEQPHSVYTMQQESFGEIAVTGRDEAEATVVDIHDEIHPSDLATSDVEAELIGSHVWAEPVGEQVAVADAVATMDDPVSANAYDATVNGGAQIMEVSQAASFDLPGTEEAQAVVVDVAEDVHPSDHDVPGVEAAFIGNDYNSGTSMATSLTASQIWAEPDQHVAVATLSSASVAAPAVIAEADGSAVAIASESQAAVVGITEDVHPADLEVPGVQAEFVGQDFSQNSVSYGSEVWAEPEPGNASDNVAVATATATVEGGEAQATVVGISDDTYPNELEYPGVQAELVTGGYHRATTLPETEAHALPLISRAEDNPRAQSAPGCVTNPFVDDPHDTPAMSRDALAALDAMDSSTSHHPTKEVYEPPRTPVAVAQAIGEDGLPPIPVRSVATRDTSHTSNVSRLSSNSSGGDLGAPPSRSAAAHVTSNTSSQYTADVASPATRATQQVVSSVARGGTRVMRTTNNVIERLFGIEGNSSRRGGSLNLDAAGSVLPRTLLPWSVFPSETTGMWVATVNTNQKALDSNNITEASKALRAFSVPTKAQAEALARAWAPPRMLPFSDNPVCLICEARFAVFKRPCHCRNCGVCICSGCSLQWPSKMIPDTYNIKKESTVNICKSCDWLCSAFRMAMLQGNHDQAVAIHATGNVNLVTPFANVKGELFYPVHTAVLGGSLSLLQWLVDTHCCPLRSIRISGKTRQSSGSFTPVLTSRGRSLLGIAMEKENVDLVRYLVVDKGMPLTGEKDMNMGNLIRLLDKILRTIPPTTMDNGGESFGMSQQGIYGASTSSIGPGNAPPGAASGSTPSRQSEASWRADEALAYELSQQQSRHQDDHSEGSVEDACIICFANSIDCVVTPCGHQICCMTCSSNISRCPVCGVDCSFIRVFRAN